MLRKGELKADEVEHLIIGKQDPNPPPLPETLKNFITENIWASCKGLEIIPAFNGLGASLEADNLQWKRWYQEERVEVAELPKAYKEIGKFQKLLLLRAMRPDRVTSALTIFVSEAMTEKYV
jgi:dynein heavy chain